MSHPTDTAAGRAAPSSAPLDPAQVRFTLKPYAELSLDALYDALQLRAEVFVLEQNCPYQDLDGADRASDHLLGHAPDGRLAAYCRLPHPGVKYAEASIGRVITAPFARGIGLGHRLMAEAVACATRAWPASGIRISAQAHLAPFYGTLGFVSQGAVYLEDNIPHIEMLRAPERPVSGNPGAPMDKITLERWVRATPEAAWKAWTTPADICAWNHASDDWHTPRASVELRPGGAFNFHMAAKDGSAAFDFEGRYLEVDPPRRIVSEFGGRQLEVTFTPKDGGVLVRESFDPETTHTREQQREGWQAILDNFARHVEGGAA